MKYLKTLLLGSITLFLLFSCGNKITRDNIPNQSAVEVTLTQGKKLQGMVKNSDKDNIFLVLQKDNKTYKIPRDKIADVREIDVIYDDYARPITDKEISHAKSYWRTVSFTVLGSIVGGAIGFFAGQQDVDEPEVFSTGTFVGAGVGAVTGILLGLPADQRKAVAKVRANRANDIPAELMQEKKKEEEELKKIEDEKKRLQEKLKQKKG
jgi:hypothetical protein